MYNTKCCPYMNCLFDFHNEISLLMVRANAKIKGVCSLVFARIAIRPRCRCSEIISVCSNFISRSIISKPFPTITVLNDRNSRFRPLFPSATAYMEEVQPSTEKMDSSKTDEKQKRRRCSKICRVVLETHRIKLVVWYVIPPS